MALLPLDDALALILKDAKPASTEQVSLVDAGGRIAAAEVKAKLLQPPFDCSAMDGYAFIAPEQITYPLNLTLIGESAAGNRFIGNLHAGDAIRIFTGAPMPEGANTVVIQEDTERNGDIVTILSGIDSGRHIRRAGLDFAPNDTLVKIGEELDSSSLSLAAAGGNASVAVFTKPRVAIIATGDELVPPGVTPGADQIVASNSVGIGEIVRRAGGVVSDKGIIEDKLECVESAIRDAFASGVDVLVTIGGASVGDRDFAFQALKNCGVELGFWKIAMRPGKPLMYGQKKDGERIIHVLGLPGNPVSSLVCARLFLKPLVTKLSGSASTQDIRTARLGAAVRANDFRRDFLRATLSHDANNDLIATPMSVQDSSMLTALSRADALLIREENAPAGQAGDPCQVLMLR